MVRFWWMFVLFAKTASASDNELPDSEAGKESRFLPLFEKRYDRPIGPGGLPPLTTVPVAGERCSQRLESALDNMKRRKRNQPKTLDSPASQSIELNGYSLYQQMRSAPVDMYVTRMRVRLPQNANWVRVEKCYFDPRNVSLDTMLLFHDITISGNVDLYDANELDRNIPPSRRLRRHYADRRYDGYPDEYRYRQGNGCNMILRLRKAGIGFHTRPLHQQPGKFNVKTDSEFVEPGFISVYAYGCEKYINRNSVRNKDNLPLRRKRSLEHEVSGTDNTWNTDDTPRYNENEYAPLKRTKRYHLEQVSDTSTNSWNTNDESQGVKPGWNKHTQLLRRSLEHDVTEKSMDNTWNNVFEPQTNKATYQNTDDLVRRKRTHLEHEVSIPDNTWKTENEYLPSKRRKRSDEFTFDPRLEPPEISDSRSSDNTWNTVYEPRSRVNYERSKLFRPDDDLDEVEDISREMEDIFTKGIRTLLTTYMKKELQPAIKDTLMRNMGYVISYG